MKIESNKNWTTCLRLNTGDGSPRVFLLNSHFLGSVPFIEPTLLLSFTVATDFDRDCSKIHVDPSSWHDFLFQ